MAGKSRIRAARGLYAGLTLAEWRGSVRVCQSSGWWQFASQSEKVHGASSLHFAVVQAATLLLPLAWHRDHGNRFHAEWYAQRRAAVNARAVYAATMRERGIRAT
jgi:hypothetical protein